MIKPTWFHFYYVFFFFLIVFLPISINIFYSNLFFCSIIPFPTHIFHFKVRPMPFSDRRQGRQLTSLTFRLIHPCVDGSCSRSQSWSELGRVNVKKKTKDTNSSRRSLYVAFKWMEKRHCRWEWSRVLQRHSKRTQGPNLSR